MEQSTKVGIWQLTPSSICPPVPRPQALLPVWKEPMGFLLILPVLNAYCVPWRAERLGFFLLRSYKLGSRAMKQPDIELQIKSGLM